MAKLAIQPYFHPTTVVFVDDSIDFLSNLSLQLDAALAYRLFDSPSSALKYINNTKEARSLSHRFFATIKDTVSGSTTEPVLHLDMAAIQQEVRNTERFAETAVVIVDYAMPQMNGIEFCEQIDSPHIKKVLFTGVADEEVAVRAFNEGIIDRFIRKSERDVYEEVNTTIKKLQKAYIRETAQTISHVLSLRNRDYLVDPVFADFFRKLRKEHGFVEYYMSTGPNGFLLLDADGHSARLIALTNEELALHAKYAQTRGAPRELVDTLENGDSVPYFESTPDGFYPQQCENWRECLYPAETLNGHNQYHWALVPYTKTRSVGVVASYNGYLDWLDTISYALF